MYAIINVLGVGVMEINFKYHPNVWKQNVFKKAFDDEVMVCQCCNRPLEFYIDKVYSSQDIDCICPKCVADGSAFDKFNATFIQDAELDKVSVQEIKDELLKKTPGYDSWQGEHWLACCNDFCEYIGETSIAELKAMKIDKEVIADYKESNEYHYENCADHLGNGVLRGYLFRCLHCRRYRIWFDAD